MNADPLVGYRGADPWLFAVEPATPRALHADEAAVVQAATVARGALQFAIDKMSAAPVLDDAEVRGCVRGFLLDAQGLIDSDLQAIENAVRAIVETDARS